MLKIILFVSVNTLAVVLFVIGKYRLGVERQLIRQVVSCIEFQRQEIYLKALIYFILIVSLSFLNVFIGYYF